MKKQSKEYLDSLQGTYERLMNTPDGRSEAFEWLVNGFDCEKLYLILKSDFGIQHPGYTKEVVSKFNLIKEVYRQYRLFNQRQEETEITVTKK